MHELGVSATMLCWYFGNYPGLMNKAAGELSFEPFPANADDFLLDLARIDWGRNAECVAEAWKRFAEGYENYPLTCLFQYYGPMHDGPVWPLLLEPEDAPLSPTWLLGSVTTREPYPPSGDRIGEAFGYTHTLAEILELCRRLTSNWDRGLALLDRIAHEYEGNRERLLDLGVAAALGVQFRSGYNILRFYDLRERLLRTEGPGRLELLAEMEAIVHAEIANDEELLRLCQRDSRLGFHSEAEGYKYFPAKIRWRMERLRALLADGIPRFRRAIREGQLLFPEYTGRRTSGPCVTCRYVPDASSWPEAVPGAFPAGADVRRSLAHGNADAEDGERETRWTVVHDLHALYVLAHCTEPNRAELKQAAVATDFEADHAPGGDSLTLKLEPRRLWPCKRFVLAAGGGRSTGEPFAGGAVRTGDGWRAVLRIPFAAIEVDPVNPTPIRIDVQRRIPAAQTRGRGVLHSWLEPHPLTPRLRHGSDNPADLGWVVFDPSPQPEQPR